MDLTKLLAFAIKNDASDLHLSGGHPPVLRVAGELKPTSDASLTGEIVRRMIVGVMTDQQRAMFDRDWEIDFAISFGNDARFRVNAFTNARGAAAVFRRIPTRIPTLAELKSPSILTRLAELPRGLVLVTGPTGSGKSTTLAAMLDHINATSANHILTIEDPVEFVHTPKMSVINHREVGSHTRSFARALKSALREDPDVILVGEMRDHETISLALTAAETGHLVLGTLHTSSAAKTIDRIIDVFPAGDKEMVRAMLSGSLEAVVSQALIRTCAGGRVAAHEILVGTPAIRNLIRENGVAQIQSMIQIGQRYGMQTMADAVGALVQAGTISQADAVAVTRAATAEETESMSSGQSSKGGLFNRSVKEPVKETGGKGKGYSF